MKNGKKAVNRWGDASEIFWLNITLKRDYETFFERFLAPFMIN
jgi:hypothetical protein